MSYEIHPETPPGGIPLAEYFRGADMERMHEMLSARAAEFGLPFTAPRTLSNSRAAILAVEHAREEGRHDALRRLIFTAYFAEGKDIGDVDVLASLAVDAGIDPTGLRRSLVSEQYAVHLAEASNRARSLGITGVPTFFIISPAAPGSEPDETTHRIVGAQPLEAFRAALRTR